MRNTNHESIVHFLLLFGMIGASMLALVMIKDYVGFAGVEVPARGGYITTILIDSRQQSINWAGVFGLVFSQSGFNESQTVTLNPGDLVSQTFVFTCMDPNQNDQEIYASLNSTIDFSALRAGSTKMIDVDLLNLSNSSAERANNTFKENISVLLGATNISGIPAMYTYVNNNPDGSRTFFAGIMNSSNNLVFVIRVLQNAQTSFKGSLVEYQAMLPVANSSKKYYFFTDPNDECPSGFGLGQLGDSRVAGYVLEANTSLPLPNATISAGGNISTTDSGGFFNITIPGSRLYDLIGIKEGYNTNITRINTTIGQTTFQNLTMSRFFGFLGSNMTVAGYVKDNSTNIQIANATVSIGGSTASSNATGNFSFLLPHGTYVVAAVKTNYLPFVGNFSAGAGQNLSFVINMTPAVESIPQNGTIQGFVRDSLTNAVLSGVAVTVSGFSGTTDGSGFYNITTLSGTQNIVAVKSGYYNYGKEINISANSVKVHNFSMDSLVVPAPANGTVEGIVKTSSGSVLSGVAVSVAGNTNNSNSTGKYLLQQIPAGTHNLVATKSGYSNHIAVINVTSGNTTSHNITMTTLAEAGLGAGQGAGKGTGEGAGKGAGQGAGTGAGLQSQTEIPTKIIEYEISAKKILKKLSVGNFLAVPISISNYKEETMELKFGIEGDIEKMARMNKESMAIPGGEADEVVITLLGNVEPGVYEGYFVISGDINEKVPIYVLVLEKERIGVESLVIKITPLEKRLAAGDLFKYTVDLQNLLSEERYKVSLSYSIDGISNNRSTFLEKEEIVIQTSFSILKSFRIPGDLGTGDYALKVHADFLDKSTEQSTIFTVAEPLYRYAVLGFIPLWMLAALIGTLSTGTFGVLAYKKKKDDKKRYQIDVDYSQLPKAGPRSAYAGNVAETHNKAFFDLDLFQVHTLIAGSSGSGKSVVAQVLVEEALLKNVAVVVFDPTAQWTGFLRKCDDRRMLAAYQKYGMKRADARAFNGNVHQVQNPREITEFSKLMKPGEINIFVTNKLDTKEVESFAANTIKEVFHAHLPESKELKYLIVYDGIHSLLPKFGGSGGVFVQIERATREFRKWGVGLILISQVLSDFPPEVLANINTEVQVRTKDENDLNRTKEKYGEKILQSVVKAAVGTGMVQNSAYNKGKPYFVAFRPAMHSLERIGEQDLENYNKYNTVIDDLDYQLEQLEKESIDVFDLKLELKLSQDKVKSGNFNMVNIYLDGLKPRIKAQWDKLGKQPKKKEIKYFEEDEVKEEAEDVKKEAESESAGENSSGIGIKQENGKEKTGLDNEGGAITENEQEKNENNAIEDSINLLVEEVKADMQNNEKEKAVMVYYKIQEAYRNSPKEIKPRILGKCIEAQKAIAEA